MSFADRPRDQNNEERALAFLRSAREIPDLSPIQIQRIETRLDHPAREKRVLRLAAVLILPVVLMAGGAVAVARVGLRHIPLLGSLFLRPNVAPGGGSSPGARQHSVAVESRPPRVAPSSPRAQAPARVRSLVDSPRRVAFRSRGAPPTPERSRDEAPILLESQSFSAALTRWHRDHDATAALAALDSHERHFPSGHFQLEATILRAEILLRQGQEQQGLRLLDAVSLVGLPRARELQTVRGELRIKLGRCADGRRDLDAVLATDTNDLFGQRAVRASRLCP